MDTTPARPVDMTSRLLHTLARPLRLGLLLGCATAIPILLAGLLSLQICLGTVPVDSQRLLVAPVALFMHALAGMLFGITGFLQFIRAVRSRLGHQHRMLGRVFVVTGTVVGLSGLTLLLRVKSDSTAVLDVARYLAGAALLAMLARGMQAIRQQNLRRHRACMIRAYAIGMGSGTVALAFLPIYAVTGEPPRGLGADLVVVICWILTLIVAELVIRRAPCSPRRGAHSVMETHVHRR